MEPRLMVLVWWILMAAHRKALAARRRQRTGAYAAWTALAGATWLAASLSIAWFVGLLITVGLGWAALLIGGLTLGAALLGPIARVVWVPLGEARAAHWCTRRSYVAEDAPAAALVLAAWAVCRQREVRGEDVAWLEELRTARGRTGDTEVAATALLAWARGDRDLCRALLDSVGELAERTPAVRELAGEWLAADDAERGAWDRLAARAGDAWPASPLTYFLEGAAARLTGAAVPGRAALVMRWLEAPRRPATFPLLRRALDAAPVAPATQSAAGASDTPAPALPGALAPHAACVRAHGGGGLDGAALSAAATAWDRVLGDAGTRLDVLQRAAALGAGPDAGERALRRVAEEAAADLAGLALAARVPLASLAGSTILAAAARHARHRLLAELESSFAALADRCSARQAMPAIDEWRAFLALRAAYQRAAAAGGLELRRLVFPHAHTAMNRLAVWLWNERGEHVLSQAISTWLLGEALAVGDTQAIELHTANAAIRVPART